MKSVRGSNAYLSNPIPLEPVGLGDSKFSATRWLRAAVFTACEGRDTTMGRALCVCVLFCKKTSERVIQTLPCVDGDDDVVRVVETQPKHVVTSISLLTRTQATKVIKTTGTPSLSRGKVKVRVGEWTFRRRSIAALLFKVEREPESIPGCREAFLNPHHNSIENHLMCRIQN
jgi:hypothetical protein